MPETPLLLALGEVPFIRLTTFRTTGEPVGTTVWVDRDVIRITAAPAA